MKTSATLILKDGSIFEGKAFGCMTQEIGELCFQTAMTGYQEIITDPSYKGHIIIFAFPHIGNCGINENDMESQTVHTCGVIMQSKPTKPSNWRSQKTLKSFFLKHKVPGIYNINTRILVQHIRDYGAQPAIIMHGSFNLQDVMNRLNEWHGIEKQDLTHYVMCKKPYVFSPIGSYHIVVMDYGVKRNILRSLKKRDCRVTVIPGNTKIQKILNIKPDGIIISNGPGDPLATSQYTTPIIQTLIKKNIPLFGICLGHQMLVIALGGSTFKMSLGHHGANHPIQNTKTKNVEITSQNHGFAVSIDLLPKMIQQTAFSLFDHTLEALEMKDYNVFSVQFHPEASPGPYDTAHYFDLFINMVKKNIKSYKF